MKKLLAVLVAIALVTSIASAQIYVKGGLGYNLSLGGIEIGDNYDGSVSPSTDEGVYGSYGQGINFSGAIGTKLNDHMKAELGIGFLIGATHEVTYKGFTYSTVPPYNSNVPYTDTYKYSSSDFFLNPAILLTTDIFGAKPYVKFGLIVGIASGKREETSTEFSGTNTETVSGGILLGFNGAAGAFYAIDNKISLFGELCTTSGSWSPTKWEYKPHTGVTTSGAFSKKITNSTSNTDELQPSYPFGSLGINVGIMLSL